MSEWVNYGDTNFVEHGGILLSLREGRHDEFDFIEVRPNGDDERMYAVSGYLYVNDYTDEEKKKEICECVGIAPDFFTKNNPMDYACSIIEYYGGANLDGRPIIHDSKAVDHSNIEEEVKTACFVTKYELYNYLNDIGFEIEYEDLKKAMDYDAADLADVIEDFMYDRGEYEYSTDRIPRWLDSENDRSKTVDNIKETLESGADEIDCLIEYFDGELTAMSPMDELVDKAEILKSCLEAAKSRELEKDEYTKGE